MEQTLDLAASDNCCLQTSKVAPRVPFPAPDLAFISFHQTPFSWAVTIDFLWRPKTRPLYGPVCPFLTLMATRMGRHTIRRSGIFRSSPPAREKRIVLCGSKWVRGGKAVCFLTLSPIHLSLSLSLSVTFSFFRFFSSLSRSPAVFKTWEDVEEEEMGKGGRERQRQAGDGRHHFVCPRLFFHLWSTSHVLMPALPKCQ